MKRIRLRMELNIFVKGCKKSLSELNIKTGKIYNEKNKDYERMYATCIYGKNNIKNFNKLINLIHPQKRRE